MIGARLDSLTRRLSDLQTRRRLLGGVLRGIVAGAAAPAGTFDHDAPACAMCDTQATPSDNYCPECGSPFGEPAPVAFTRTPVTRAYAPAA